jgi:hypothetical protein
MALAKIVRFRRAVLAAAFLPSSRPVAWSSSLRAVAVSASADIGVLLRATHVRASAALGGGSERCLVLNPQRTSARRMLASSGRPRAPASIAGVAAVNARAMSLRYLAEACFHFMSTWAQANSYQPVSALVRSQAIGLPVARLNASPFRAAVSRALRKLSACAAVRNASCYCGHAKSSPIAGQLTSRRPLSSPLLCSRGSAGSRWFGREKRRGDDHQGDGLSGNDGDCPRRGRRQSCALPGGDPTGAASRRLVAVPASCGLVVARRADRHRPRTASSG